MKEVPGPTPEQLRAAKVLAAENRVRAVNLRKTGMTYGAIADQLGISEPTAWRYVKQALANLAEERKFAAEELRSLSLDRIDSSIGMCLKDLHVRKRIQGENGQEIEIRTDPIKPRVMALLIKLEQERNALLDLYPKQKIEVETRETVEDVLKEIDRETVVGGLADRISPLQIGGDGDGHGMGEGRRE